MGKVFITILGGAATYATGFIVSSIGQTLGNSIYDWGRDLLGKKEEES